MRLLWVGALSAAASASDWPARDALHFKSAQESIDEVAEPQAVPVIEEGKPTETPPVRLEPSVELALSDETFWLGFRSPLRRGAGQRTFGFLGTERDDYVIQLAFMRHGTPTSDSRLTLGAGIGGYAAFLDEEDAKAFAITLGGSVAYTVPTAYPVTALTELAFAPDVTTFKDGDRFVDVLARVEVELSADAAAFIGYRFVETELVQGDREIDDRWHFGIRLGF